MLNIFVLAFLECEREGITSNSKKFGRIWEKRVYTISRYISHMNRKRSK